MEFENVNNFNLALEAAAKKKSHSSSIIRNITHAIKKMLRRAKPICCSADIQPMSQEEMDNAQNEALESKFTFEYDVERDLRPFAYVTEFQVATRQSYVEFDRK